MGERRTALPVWGEPTDSVYEAGRVEAAAAVTRATRWLANNAEHPQYDLVVERFDHLLGARGGLLLARSPAEVAAARMDVRERMRIIVGAIGERRTPGPVLRESARDSYWADSAQAQAAISRATRWLAGHADHPLRRFVVNRFDQLLDARGGLLLAEGHTEVVTARTGVRERVRVLVGAMGERPTSQPMWSEATRRIYREGQVEAQGAVTRVARWLANNAQHPQYRLVEARFDQLLGARGGLLLVEARTEVAPARREVGDQVLWLAGTTGERLTEDPSWLADPDSFTTVKYKRTLSDINDANG
ncbi:hypothetical protein, partial [Enterococcus hirae]|uniref:hypothetical protein n=1 Tax=Enterococcus hirae TaxID=1354 RepID=UPI00136B7FBB